MICSCANGSPTPETTETIIPEEISEKTIVVGAAKFDAYLSMLEGKSVGIVGNQSSLVGTTHLVDTLLSLKVDVQKVFCPEHGFRGDADAGEQVGNSNDIKTGLPLISLYGKNKKPSKEQMKGIDVIIFDIQDVGVRFYTYISTLHYVMEACAENNVKLIILDRPNPNGHYVDGPVLELDFSSFVGMHPVPIVHGMTIGEYGSMINGQGWLGDQVKCELVVITCDNYTHDTPYSLPVAPSPNLRSDLSIQLYPSLCLLEGTEVSCGRGTDCPFERYGHPDFSESEFFFIPESGYGSKSPKFEGQKCYEINLRDTGIERATKFDISYLIDADEQLNGQLWAGKKKIFNLLAGNDTLWRQIKAGSPESDIRKTWEPALSEYKEMRKKYLLYD
ncbi:MAG: DUF1343 domain-containing protein [Crocinitomicaceae bacterium]|nr:DUF1343 domain-containing protein [Crocinitomicaceae bacterium]